MVSFNHGVSSLTRKDLALKYNLCALRRAAAARAPGPRGSRARTLLHGLRVQARLLERIADPRRPAPSPGRRRPHGKMASRARRTRHHWGRDGGGQGDGLAEPF